MNKQVRDWQEDMTEVQKEIESYKKLAETFEAVSLAAGKALKEAETRENKLREAIEDTIDAFRLDGSNYRADTLEQLLASLYPEEETK